MIKTTRAQRIALKRIYRRDQTVGTYREFRQTVEQGYNCLMVYWEGMWLGIETDGYTHN